jgi:hypothetical protein
MKQRSTTTRQTPSAPAALDPVGSYALELMEDGTISKGTMEVADGEGAYGGRVLIGPDLDPIVEVVVSGQRMQVTANTPDGPLLLTMDIRGREFTGSWMLGGTSGALSGQRTS